MSMLASVVALLSCLAPIGYLGLIYPRLPGRVPMQWDVNGQATWTASRLTFLLFILLGASVCGLVTIVTGLTPHSRPEIAVTVSVMVIATNLVVFWAVRKNARLAG